MDTLNSIALLNLPENIEIEVIVVDNDEMLSGKVIFDQLKENYIHKIIYASEPKKNISAARNMCLKQSNGEWIAFIDDDEIADQDWLLNLYNTSQKYQASAVFGRVISTFPANTPSWIIEGGFFERKERVTGTTVSSGACNCTLVSRAAIDNQIFDLAYGLSGGEDADFFHRIFNKGHKLVYCREAIVSEEIELHRLNIEFLISRKIRIGSSFSKYRYENKKLFVKSVFFTKNLFILVADLLMTAFSYPLGKKIFYKKLLRSADRYGKLKYFFHSNLEELY